MNKKTLLTAIQSSGTLHIGNYFGALKPFLEIYSEYSSFLMVADCHSLTSLKDPTVVRQNIINVARDYLAIGIDPGKAIFFQQSDVLEHTELMWIFQCLITMSFLQQAHAYKDKTVRGLEANVGLFTYPVLMAADILLYDTDIVPVGEDQRQHIEYTREIAAKFNNTYGTTFKEPREYIQKESMVVPGTDGQKMSKSYKNTIPLFGSREEIQKAVMSIVTDSDGKRPENVYAIHRLYRSENELASLYEANRGNYKILKEALAEDIDSFIAPMREKRMFITDEDVRRVLIEGTEKARTIASVKMSEVRKKIGVVL